MKPDDHCGAFVVAGRDGNLLCFSDLSGAMANHADPEHFRRGPDPKPDRLLETRQAEVGNPVIGRVAQRAILSGDQPLLDANDEVDRVLAKPPKLREVREVLGRLCLPRPADAAA